MIATLAMLQNWKKENNDTETPYLKFSTENCKQNPFYQKAKHINPQIYLFIYSCNSWSFFVQAQCLLSSRIPSGRKEEASIYFGVSDYLIYDASPLS